MPLLLLPAAFSSTEKNPLLPPRLVTTRLNPSKLATCLNFCTHLSPGRDVHMEAREKRRTGSDILEV